MSHLNYDIEIVMVSIESIDISIESPASLASGIHKVFVALVFFLKVFTLYVLVLIPAFFILKTAPVERALDRCNQFEKGTKKKMKM